MTLQQLRYVITVTETTQHYSFAVNAFVDLIKEYGQEEYDFSLQDRATLFNLLIGLNGYTVCSGVIDEKLNGKENICRRQPKKVSSGKGIRTDLFKMKF